MEQARGDRSPYWDSGLAGPVPSHQLLSPASVSAGKDHEADAADRRARQGEGISALLSLARSASVYPPQLPPY